MKTIPEYLSGSRGEELRVLVAETFCKHEKYETFEGGEESYDRHRCLKCRHWLDDPNPPYSTSLDACRELLEDLTEEDFAEFCEVLQDICRSVNAAIRATARQTCVAYLIVKGVLK